MNPIPKFKLTCQHKQAQIKYDANEENKYQVNHYYKFGDKLMLINDQDNKYEITFKVSYNTTQTWINET